MSRQVYEHPCVQVIHMHKDSLLLSFSNVASEEESQEDARAKEDPFSEMSEDDNPWSVYSVWDDELENL